MASHTPDRLGAVAFYLTGATIFFIIGVFQLRNVKKQVDSLESQLFEASMNRHKSLYWRASYQYLKFLSRGYELRMKGVGWTAIGIAAIMVLLTILSWFHLAPDAVLTGK